jgi:hypothetical protein
MTATYIGIKGHARGAGVSAEHVSGGRGEPVPGVPFGVCVHDLERQFDAGERAGAVAAAAAQRLTATAQYTIREIHRQRGAGRPGAGEQRDRAELAGPERGTRPFEFRPAAPVDRLQTQYSSGVGVRGGALLRGWKGAAFKGWTLISQINAGSGLPATPVYGGGGGDGSDGSIRPDTRDIGAGGSPGRHLNPAAYAAPQAGQWGTAGRNSIVGPSQFTLNASMGRTFAENLDLRFDSTNALNHVTYPSWNTVVTSSQFGLP